MRPLIAIPAAGASRRMRGKDKLLEHVDGEPLLRRQVKAALRTGCPVLVLLPAGGDDRREAIEDLGPDIRIVEDATEGMSASLRMASVAADGGPLGILLPDVPGISEDDIRTVIEKFAESGGEAVTRATDPDCRPGTPLFLPPRVARRLQRLSGDDGGRSTLADEAVTLVRFPDARATRDLDTPEAWEAWRRETGRDTQPT